MWRRKTNSELKQIYERVIKCFDSGDPSAKGLTSRWVGWVEDRILNSHLVSIRFQI